MAKVAFLINSMAGGGAERVVSILLKNLSRENRELFLIVLEDKFYYQIPQDVKVIKLNSSFFGFLKLKKIIRKNQINLVFSFLGRSNYTNILAKLFGSRHQTYISERINPSEMHRAKNLKAILNTILLKRLYKKADLIFSNSLGIKNSLNQDFNLPLDKIKVIYNPIDLEKIRNLCQDDLEPKYQEIFKNLVIINIARLTKQKGQEYLIRAFKIVADQIQGVKLLILGEGELEKNLKNLVKKLGLENDVLFLGWQKNPFKFLAKAKVFALSSLWEGFPNTLIEALACGTPVISTDCPSGPNEIIENAKSGLLVPVKDEKALSQAMIRILEYPITANYFSKQGKEKANDFSIERIIKQYERIIQ